MKKFAVLFYIIATCTLLVFCVQCKKDETCGVIIRVHRTTTGIDTGAVVPNAYVKIGLEENYADFAKAEGYTDVNGVFTHTFQYEALLGVAVTCEIIELDTAGNVVFQENLAGADKVKLEPGEAVEKVILVSPM